MSATNAIGGPKPVPTVETFTTSQTWTKPANFKYAVVQIQAGGGGGGTAIGPSTRVSNGAGSGGNGGAYVEFIVTDAQMPATVSMTIPGAAAAGSAASAVTFGALASCGGGSAGTQGNGAGFIGVGAPTSGGSITVTTGTIVHQSNGRRGGTTWGRWFSAGTQVIGFVGNGGSTFSAGAGIASQGLASNPTMSNTSNQSLGNGPGGGGAIMVTSNTGSTGGNVSGQAGRAGFIRITSYFK